MNGEESREIITELVKNGNHVKFSCDDSEVELTGNFTINDLHAILHYMEYSD